MESQHFRNVDRFHFNAVLQKQYTIIQKLSKCEIKAWLCSNLIILLPIRFYVKSNFGKFNLSKNVILTIFSNRLEGRNPRFCPGDFTEKLTTRARIILLSKFLPGWSTTRARIILLSKFLPRWSIFS